MALGTRPTPRMAKALLLLSAIPAVCADCFIDQNTGEEVCNGLPIGARLGIGFGIILLVILLLVALGVSRRRRIQRANQAYITNANVNRTYPAPGYNYDQRSYGPANVRDQVPQYPPQSHVPYDQYTGAPAYSPSYHPSSPPQYPTYAPPPGPAPQKT